MAIVDLRYARALDEVVVAQKLSREAVKTQLQDFLTTFQGSAPLREVLENPSIEEAQKLHLLDAIAGRLGMDRAVRNFLAVVIHHLRLRELREMFDAYLEIADKDNGVTEAEVTSARPLDAAGKQTIEDSIARLAGGGQVRASYREDPTLLGGAVIKLGSTVYDGSLRGQLEQLRQKMLNAVV